MWEGMGVGVGGGGGARSQYSTVISFCQYLSLRHVMYEFYCNFISKIISATRVWIFPFFKKKIKINTRKQVGLT